MTTADTGCSVNLIALRIAKEHKLTLTTHGLPQLVTATGADMTVNGQANITVSSGTKLTQLNILISSDLDEDMEKAKVVVVHHTMKRGDSPDILL